MITSALPQEPPQSAPIPAFRDELRAPSSADGQVPLPEPRPGKDEPGPGRPVPPAGPGRAPLPDSGSEAASPAAAPPPKLQADPRSAMRPDPSGALPRPEAECRQRLAELRAEFEGQEAEFDAVAGCSVPYPLMLRSFGPDIALEPGAEMSCAMAEAAARFVQEVAAPAARAALGQPLKSVSQASAYVCRPRHGGGKLSEHAFGNALDIASFTLADGTTIAVELQPPPKAADFLGRVRRAACGPFSTVLGPGSDADHATHLHFDLQPRRSGGSFCQ